MSSSLFNAIVLLAIVIINLQHSMALLSPTDFIITFKSKAEGASMKTLQYNEAYNNCKVALIDGYGDTPGLYTSLERPSQKIEAQVTMAYEDKPNEPFKPTGTCILVRKLLVRLEPSAEEYIDRQPEAIDAAYRKLGDIKNTKDSSCRGTSFVGLTDFDANFFGVTATHLDSIETNEKTNEDMKHVYSVLFFVVTTQPIPAATTEDVTSNLPLIEVKVPRGKLSMPRLSLPLKG